MRRGDTWAMAREADLVVGVARGCFGVAEMRAGLDALVELGIGARRAVLDVAGLGDGGLRFAATELARRELARAEPNVSIDLVIPLGLAGAIVAGAVHDHDATLHHDREALPADARAALERLDHVLGDSSLRADVRIALDADPSVSAAGLAARLGLSTRSLQRHLVDAGTSFRLERQRARMELAIEHLCASHDKIGVVARTAGFASESRFCHAFRAYTGLAPTRLRETLAP